MLINKSLNSRTLHRFHLNTFKWRANELILYTRLPVYLC